MTLRRAFCWFVSWMCLPTGIWAAVSTFPQVVGGDEFSCEIVLANTGATGPRALGYAEVIANRFGSGLSGMLGCRLGDYEVSVPAGRPGTEGHIFVASPNRPDEPRVVSGTAH